jgi:hypothetical protein
MQAIPKAVPKDFDTSCVTASADGACFSLLQAEEARAYFSYHGFVVVRDVTSEEENARAMAALLHDIHEVNPAVSAVTDLSQFAEHDLPTSPNNAFRATCNMAFGRFASAVRLAPGIRKAFATIHQTPPDALACSWDIPFYTPQPDRVPSGKALQLHWDHNWYYGGTQAPLADALCAQGVYYATATDPSTPSFVCVPRSHTVWRTFCESDLNPAKRGAPILSYLPLTHFDEQFLCDSGLDIEPSILKLDLASPANGTRRSSRRSSVASPKTPSKRAKEIRGRASASYRSSWRYARRTWQYMQVSCL